MMDLSACRGRRIVVAMSGGVDSSVAAALLRQAGADVVGVHMRVHRMNSGEAGPGDRARGCCSPADAMDARRVAEKLAMPFYALDFEEDFRRAVIDPFVEDYLAGRTPNPCVRCNTHLKLGTLLAKARGFGAEAVATGHYARLRRSDQGRVELLRAADDRKDQSYYLFELRQSQLERFVLPLGELTKAETRAIARRLDLPVADKPDSQEICFIPDGDYRRFVDREARADARDLQGEIVDTTGRVLGRHAGVHNFTIGQRRGLGLAALPAAASAAQAGTRPLYVLDLIAGTRTVVVGEAEATWAAGLRLRGLNWVSEPPTDRPLRVRARVRYHHEPAPATLYPTGLPAEPGAAQAGAAGEPDGSSIEFDAPQRAITPGQAVVCYDEPTGERVIAGGWIVGPRHEERLDPAAAPGRADRAELALGER